MEITPIYIELIYLNFNNSTITLTPYNEQVLMFKVKFIDVSYSSYINTKNGKTL